MTTNMSNPSAAFLGGINKTVDAYQNNPQALQQEIQQDAKKPLIQQKLQKLIALEMISKDYKAAENQVKALSNPFTNTVFERKAQEVVGLKEADVANRIAAVEQTKAAEQRKRLQQLAGQGLPAVKTAKAGGSVNKLNMGGLVGEYVRNPTMKAANGGLVSFDNGGGVRSWYGAETAKRENREETMQDYLWDLGAGGLEDFYEFAGENWETVILTAPFLGEVLKKIPYGPSKALGEALTSAKVPREIKKAFQKWKQARKGGKDFLASAREAAPAGALWTKGVGKPPTGHPFQDLISAGQTVKSIARKAWDKTIKPLTYGGLGWMAAGNWAAPGDDTPESNAQIDGLTAALEAKEGGKREAELIAQMQAGQTPTVSQDRADIEGAYDETAGAYETGMGALNTSLQAATDRQKTDDAARATLQSKLTKEMDAQTEAYERGIGTVKSAQGTAFGEHQNAINQLEDMAKKARGTDRDYLRDLISGLSAVGQGSNLGQGLGIAGQTIVGRQDERDATARGIEKEALGEKVRLSESRLAGAKDIVGLENKLADSKVANQRLLNAEDAETRQLGTANQGLIDTIRSTIADYGVRAKEAVIRKVVALAEQSVREMTIAAQQKQLNTQDIANLTALSTNLAETLGTIPMLDNLSADEKADEQRILLERIQSIHGVVERLIGIAGI